MKRSLYAVLLALALSATDVRAEFLQIDMSIFGMD